ncbi:PaaI family thioesterase [Sphingomonas citri]|uniref:PaaI family thioesterase n=1 Tax=Sphingomonas citri TaxID=2862499 RepID=A0ABS7BSE7_9SPHN|nr:PaaI family thioesterase [Sphingomonas citri]MBW6532407.1 PaaI family thioesterase [Sphingomonas citri]
MTPPEGAAAHHRALESLYAAAPINRLFESRLEIVEPGVARIRFRVDQRHFHAAGAAHGTSYFKMLDDAAFYACNSLVTDRFLLTTQFSLLLTRPLGEGEVVAEGRWVSGQRRVFVAEARLIAADGEEVARGTGTFMRSRIALASLPGYAATAA